MNSKEDKIKELLKSSIPREENGISVSGNNNIVGNNNTIIKTDKVITKPILNIIPGEDHISEHEARVLTDLVHKIAELETYIKKAPHHIASVWATLNKRCRVTTYRAIPKDKFEVAEKFLRTWIGRLQSAPSSKKKNPTWRTDRYKAIHARCKQYNIEDKKNAYINKNFGANSLTELDDESLEKTYRHIMAIKKAL
jgi:hypothetical protein